MKHIKTTVLALLCAFAGMTNIALAADKTVTYTDAGHPSPTAVTLPMTISRGDAVTRKAIAFNAAWTPHTYTLRLHHNDGTDDCTDMAMTYDEAQNIQTVSRTGYIFDGWSTTQDGSLWDEEW